MPKITRLIVYEGSDDILATQLARSMPEGIHNKGGIKITIIKLSQEPVLNAFSAQAIEEKSNTLLFKEEFEKEIRKIFKISGEEIKGLRESKDYYTFIANKLDMSRASVKKLFYEKMYSR